MHELAAGLHALDGHPRHAFNVHVLGEEVLVDAGTRFATRRILREVAGLTLTAHALTHAHADHQGASHAVCEALGLPLLASATERANVERGDLADLAPSNVVTRWQLRNWAGPAHPVARTLAEGDEVGGFVVLETPGHSPGHLSFWREEDRTLVAGDVLFGRHPITGRPGLHEPPVRFTLDPRRNRASIRRLAALQPRVAVFGHGPAWRDPAALTAFAAGLQDDGDREEEQHEAGQRLHEPLQH
jgi:hydroxyacylglutathione hydrolase